MSDRYSEYAELLKDPRWKAKRLFIMKRDKYRCANCKSDKKLHVHHREYRYSIRLKAKVNPWEYPASCLVTLCSKCHELGHKVYTHIPTRRF
jgi:5-methylcytosine-specific restriction endonuclease McrA